MKTNLSIWRIGKMNDGPVYGLDMYQFVSDCKICLNKHEGRATDFAANARLYEITGVGSCMLTDWKKNIPDLFEIDKEILTYKTLEEAYDKIKFYLKKDELRNKISLAGQKRTLECYSNKKRFSDFFSFLKSVLE